ncbi:MAG: hypothetical protein IIY70_06415, partial [Oscillospiraceae bacterium]|nr:hypothetical protein [Oscillospiraceae bacterium]
MNALFSFIASVSFHGISGTSFVPSIPESLTYVLTQTLTYVLKLSVTDVLKLDTLRRQTPKLLTWPFREDRLDPIAVKRQKNAPRTGMKA